MTMVDLFTPNDEVSNFVVHKVASRHGIPCNAIICGIAYMLIIENEYNIKDFTLDDFMHARYTV